MKNYAQCYMCVHRLGRSCKLSNSVVSDEIYENKVKCNQFKSLLEEELDCEDQCCSEKARFKEFLNSDKDKN